MCQPIWKVITIDTEYAVLHAPTGVCAPIEGDKYTTTNINLAVEKLTELTKKELEKNTCH